MDELVSIIMPTYNSGKYINESIDSVLKQTYKNWELIIVDDCSSDETAVFIKKSYCNTKIKFFSLKKNVGAAKARQYGIDKSVGKFLAFIDSDDFWLPQKLELQIDFMEKNNYVFTATDYISMQESTHVQTLRSHYKSKMTYKDLLKYCPGNSTVILKKDFFDKISITDIKRRNDYVLWLKLIKQCKNIYFLKKPLTIYRVRNNSISSNKFSLVKYHWWIYYQIEKIGFFKSIYYTLYWIFKGTKRKILKFNS